MYKMKRNLLYPTLALAMVCTLGACDGKDDLLDSLDKLSFEAYLLNESGQDVTVTFRPCRYDNPKEHTYFVPKGKSVQIPETEPWGLQQHVYESDTVIFDFADGTRLLHYYLTENYPSDNHTYFPEENNIFYINMLWPDTRDSWPKTKIKGRRYREEYVIK